MDIDGRSGSLFLFVVVRYVQMLPRITIVDSMLTRSEYIPHFVLVFRLRLAVSCNSTQSTSSAVGRLSKHWVRIAEMKRPS